MPDSKRNNPQRRNRRITTIGDLSARIQLQDRTLESYYQNGIQDALNFQTSVVVWAKAETRAGRLEFDGSNMIQLAWTDEFTIRYRTDVKRFKWVIYQNERYKIENMEDLDRRHEFIILRCNYSGNDDPDNHAAEAM